jgi:lipoprotein-anchoring transpeptidase ErfK/SrfK
MVQRILLRAAIVLLVVVAVPVVLVARSSHHSNSPAPARTETVAAPAALGYGRQPAVFPKTPPPPPVYLAADGIAPSVAYFAAPGDATPIGSMPNPSINGGPLVFRVLAQQGDWVQVEMSKRPNGSTAWVHSSDVSIREVPNHIVVELGARRLSVYNGNNVVMQATVAVGRPSAPTPTGSYFIEGSYPTGSSGGAYGVLILTVSAFSDVYQTFAGGIGQIGIHGTNAPQLLGQAVSHGCIRMSNANVTLLNKLAPPGTAVDIQA